MFKKTDLLWILCLAHSSLSLLVSCYFQMCSFYSESECIDSLLSLLLLPLGFKVDEYCNQFLIVPRERLVPLHKSDQIYY